MADISDVERALVNTIAAQLVPAPYLQGAPVTSNVAYNSKPVTIKLYRGWPVSLELQSDLNAGLCHVSVFPVADFTRDTTRLARTWQPVTANVATVTTTVTRPPLTGGGTVMFGGVGTAAQQVGIAVGGTGYTLRLADGATDAAIAAQIGTLIPNATVVGNTVSIPSGWPTANVAVDQTMISQQAQTAQQFDISIWAASPQVRDAVGAAVNRSLAMTRALALPDGSFTDKPKLRGNSYAQKDEAVGSWRRAMRYDLEYQTVATQTFPGLLFPRVNITQTISAQFI